MSFPDTLTYFEPVSASLLDRAAATVCRLPEDVGPLARQRAILELLIADGSTSSMLETCRALDARLTALCRISCSPLLADWVRDTDDAIGVEVLVAAATAPLRRTAGPCAFDEHAFLASLRDTVALRGAA